MPTNGEIRFRSIGGARRCTARGLGGRILGQIQSALGEHFHRRIGVFLHELGEDGVAHIQRERLRERNRHDSGLKLAPLRHLVDERKPHYRLAEQADQITGIRPDRSILGLGAVDQVQQLIGELLKRLRLLACLFVVGIVGEDLPDLVERCLTQAALWDEVKDRLDTPALGLSGGQQQRLCIARALGNQPELLLMDEPCSALDPIATQRVEELIFDLKKHYTIVIVTHNMQQAARVSDYTAFFWLGRLVEYDRTDKIFTNPGEKLTEDYVTGRFG